MGMTESVVFVWRKGGSISFNNSWLFDQLKTYKLNRSTCQTDHPD